MRRLLLLLVAACALLATPTSATAQPPAVGIGDQDPMVFESPWFDRLGIRQVHHLVGWDVLDVKWQRDRLSAFVTAAAAHDANVLVAFGVSSRKSRRHVAPSVKTYRARFKAFRKRYPQVTDFVIWNEANHCSQPVCHKPRRVARYFEAARSACPRCTFVGADVLDSDSMRSWITGFKAGLRGPQPQAYGMHNYVDANRRQTTNTRWMLRNTRGKVWFTETGGLVKRRTTSPIAFPQGLTHARKTTSYVLNRLAALSPRIGRVYLYHFVNQGADQSWDSGLLNRLGTPRPAYRVLEGWLRRAKRLPWQRAATAPPA